MSQTAYNISLKGYVGGSDFDRSKVDKTLAENSGKQVNVLIDSLGGSLATGLSISAAFKNHGNVRVHFVGMNASAATIASLGAAHISIDAGAMYLVHQCSMALFSALQSAFGDNEWGSLNSAQFATLIADCEKIKADLDKLDLNCAQLYAARCKRKTEDLLALMKVGGWLTAKEAPDLDASFVPSAPAKDLFAPKKRAAWKDIQQTEARCDFAPNKVRISYRSSTKSLGSAKNPQFGIISLWKKSVYGRTLTNIKSDPGMVGFFADNITPLIRSVLGSFLSPDDFAVVTTPKRRHKERNFATLIAIRIAEQLGLPFFEDCAFAPSKHRVGTVFTANNIPPHRNIIVFDDFVTTGQTLVSMQNLLVSLGKNCTFFAGINNKL